MAPLKNKARIDFTREKKTLKETAVWGKKVNRWNQLQMIRRDLKHTISYVCCGGQFYGMAGDRIGPTLFIDDVTADRSGMNSQLFTALLCSDSVECCKADHTDPVSSANR